MLPLHGPWLPFKALLHCKIVGRSRYLEPTGWSVQGDMDLTMAPGAYRLAAAAKHGERRKDQAGQPNLDFLRRRKSSVGWPAAPGDIEQPGCCGCEAHGERRKDQAGLASSTVVLLVAAALEGFAED